jgi:hypothetical protein
MVAFKFKEWLLAEEKGKGLQDYVRGGMVHLFHYTPHRQPEVELKPEMFGKNPWTRSERKAATMQRVYFYVDLRDKEQFFSGNTLYQAVVPASQIYDLANDPEELIARIRSNGFFDIDTLLGEVKKEGYKGVYYNNGMHLVAWFNPITVTRVEEDDVLQNHFGTSKKGIEDEKAAEYEKRMRDWEAQGLKVR